MGENKRTKLRMSVRNTGLPEHAGPQVGKKDDVKTRQTGFIRFGRNNLFPEFCRALADNCTPLNTCVERMAQYIAGEGVEFLDEGDNVMKDAHRLFQDVWLEHTTVEDFLDATALDVALMNSFSWINRPSNARLTQKLEHLDVTRLRMAPKVSGEVKEYKWAPNWEDHGKNPTRYPAVSLKAYEGTMADAGVIYGRAYKQIRDYYGEPWWLPAVADSEVMTRVPIFNRTQLDTGFRAAFHLHLFDNADDLKLEEIDEQVEAVFTGANGKTYVVTYGTTEEGAPVLNKLERGDHAGELDSMGENTEERIYRAYGFPKVLLGMDTKTGMQGQALAVEQTLTMFQRTMVLPRQRKIAAALRKLMVDNGVNVAKVRIKPLTPFDPATDAVMLRQAYLRSVTVERHLAMQGMDPLPPGDKRAGLFLIEVGSGGNNEDNG